MVLMDKEFIKIAAFQGKIKEKNLNYTIDKIKESLYYCDDHQVDILCMPECYLQGYFDNYNDALNNSINLKDDTFKSFCKSISKFKTTLIVGLNEEENNKIYSTAVVIEKGICIGKYRKAYTYAPYDYFDCGLSFPTFEKNGVKYGIIICFDAAFLEPARILSLNGAQIIFCPSFNRNKNYQTISDHLDKRTNFICRSYENKVWFISSDIIWDFDGKVVCSGYATIIDNRGNFISKGNKFKEEILLYNIPLNSLRNSTNDLIFSGKKVLNKIMNKAYGNYLENFSNDLEISIEQIKFLDNLKKSEIKLLLKKTMYLPTDEKLNNIISKYTNSNNNQFLMFAATSDISMYTSISETKIIGLLALQNCEDKIIIKYISSREELRGRGIGSQFIHFISKKFTKPIEAETDDESIDFYKRNGFEILPIENEIYNIVRYRCIKFQNKRIL
jgi:predicted amidohydrolase